MFDPYGPCRPTAQGELTSERRFYRIERVFNNDVDSMPKITFVLPTGEQRTVDVEPGTTLMTAAVKNDIDGIIGECGGVCMCATCHVYVHNGFFNRLPAIQDVEEAVLDVTNAERLPSSRLSCQLKMTVELDGITVHVPASQR